ncbi:MAG: hypothetical protein FJZ79_06945 [Chlorobi bacterium]|nr:hypothetical protein [Chlorobiota bacterium]
MVYQPDLSAMLSLKRQKSNAVFPVLGSGQTLVFSPKVLKVFKTHRQISRSQPESGGLLFAKFDLPIIKIDIATPPQLEDRKSRFFFVSNPDTRRTVVRRYFRKGLHFIGEWHTHPQSDPTPSGLDVNSMKDLFRQSEHELNYFVMVIIGNRTGNLSLWVSLHDANDMHQLHPCGSTGQS